MARVFDTEETVNFQAEATGNIAGPNATGSRPIDAGETIVRVTGTTTGAGSNVSIQAVSTDPANSSTGGISPVLGMRSGSGGSARTTFAFGDDAGSTPEVVMGASDATFRIYDITGTASRNDTVTITATYKGQPVTVYATDGTSFDVTGDGSNSVTLTGESRMTTVDGSSSLISFGGLVDSITISLTSPGGSGQIYVGNIEFFPYGDICFVAGTLIRTPTGAVAVETLSEGDLIETRDSGVQTIRWIGGTRRQLSTHSALRPVRIRAGALGDNLPESDLLVSPQHRMLVRSAIAQRMFGTDEVLVAAKQLLQIDGIDIADDLDEVIYVHFIFDRHEIVYANGAESESLYTGPEALKTLSPQAREEILALFPELAEDALPEPARVLASGRLGRKLAVRHAQNDKPLVG